MNSFLYYTLTDIFVYPISDYTQTDISVYSISEYTETDFLCILFQNTPQYIFLRIYFGCLDGLHVNIDVHRKK